MSEPNWANRSMWPGDYLQLICAACNGLKSHRSQAELVAALRRNGVIG